ncbi:FadR/GntR family transcriptional regulator [Kushneria phosphatilytica]|uniref:FadR/GntR family transcriptional regulator n=1 Tax=Kushneria phosphatilytica TaxID=657387 RepID=UPI0022793A63|nr:FCD domain-containing protein [Kushneria phosphatilytica]
MNKPCHSDRTLAGETGSARQELADRIVTAIAIGAYSPGDRLPSERELAERQAVSRVTVRAALKIVSELGLIESRRGRDGGTFVTYKRVSDASPDTAQRILAQEMPQLKDFFDYRCLVEGLVARTAAERHDQQQASELQHLLDEFCATDDASRARELDQKLHACIMAMTANQHLETQSRQLTARATLGFGSEPYPAESLPRARREHKQLVQAILRRDGDEAFRAAQHHFFLTLAIMEHSLDGKPL